MEYLRKNGVTADPNDPQNAKCLACPVTVKMLFGRFVKL
jgi:hypothetical protein